MTTAAANVVLCPRCAQPHGIVQCPHVKAVEFDAGQRVSRVEFLTPTDYHRSQVEVTDGPDYPRKGEATS